MRDARSATTLDQRLGQKLRLARVAAGLSQNDLADQVGITFQQIQKYEKGANRIAATRLAAIAAVLGMPVTYFLEEGARGRGEAPPNPPGADAADDALLVCYFWAIKSAATRRNVLSLVRQIAETQEAPPAGDAQSAPGAFSQPRRAGGG